MAFGEIPPDLPLQPLVGLRGFAGRAPNPVPNSGLAHLLERNLTFTNLEDASIPFSVIVTEVSSGAEVRRRHCRQHADQPERRTHRLSPARNRPVNRQRPALRHPATRTRSLTLKSGLVCRRGRGLGLRLGPDTFARLHLFIENTRPLHNAADSGSIMICQCWE